MHTLLKTLLIAAVVALGTTAALAADPAIGSWKLNLEKSTYSPGPAPKAQIRIYAASAQGTTLTFAQKGMTDSSTRPACRPRRSCVRVLFAQGARGA